MLRVAVPSRSLYLGNPFYPDGGGTQVGLFDGLTSFTREMELRPALALSWSAVSETEWDFVLREGVTFHNGVPFGPDAVKYTIDVLKSDLGQTYPAGQSVVNIVDVVEMAPNRIRIVTQAPDPILPRRLSNVMIVEPSTWEALGADGFARSPVGTGPYVVTDWGVTSGVARLSEYEESWRATGEVSDVEMTIIGDATARKLALLSDQVDIAVIIDPDSVENLESEGFTVLAMPSPFVLGIALRQTAPAPSPLQDQRVRQALNYAVNKDAIVEVVLAGRTVAAGQPAAPSVVGHNPSILPYPHDPDSARQLLTEAGYPDGFSLTMGVFTGTIPGDALIFQLVASDLAAVGVEANLRALPFPDFMRRLYSGEWDDIDAFSLNLQGARLGDATEPVIEMSCAMPTAFFCDPELTPLLERVGSEMNLDVRTSELQNLMERLHNKAPMIWISNHVSLIGLSDRVTNYKASSTGIIFEEVRLSR